MDDGPLFERFAARPVTTSRDGLAVETRPQGLYLPAVDLYLDPHLPVERAFVSHAHADHAAAARDASSILRVMSPATANLLRARYGELGSVTELAWDEVLDLGPARIRLRPAGHILGAAALVVESDAGVLIYSGDIKPGAGLTHGAADLPACDTLVIESTFGLPVFAFPSDDACHASALEFAQRTLADGETPVFLAYALGKGQELAKLLGSHGVPVRAHGAMTKLNDAYRAMGVELPNVRPYARDDDGPPGAIIVPPRERFGAMFKRGRAAGIRVAYVSGWALLDASRERYDADLQVPLSDHASFAELDALVARCAPRRVFTTHGYADSYARHLRAMGVEARALDAQGFEA